MKQVKIGVLGAYRGTAMINYCRQATNAKVVAICDKWKEGLERQKAIINDDSVTYYDNFEDFIKHDMDAVVLANYANEHAPFAIRAMKEGKHVFSEVLPCQTMKEAVELIEAIEETGMIYAYGENYCYMPAPYEMRKLYRAGKLGEFEYGECEYIHNCESIWPSIAYGDPNHWRNNMYSTFYCTHSIGPMIHITGLRPVAVIGIEGERNARKARMGAKSGAFGIEMIELENGGVIKSIHGGLYQNSVWYSMYGSKGRVESAREGTEVNGGVDRVYLMVDEYDGEYAGRPTEIYKPQTANESAGFGHGGSDFYSMYNFVEKILGNPDADTIDIFEALDMFLPGLFAYRSILNDSKKMQIPNLRNKEEREAWRNDTACSDPKVAGDMLLPTSKHGTPEIDPAVYEHQRALWQKAMNDENGYANMAFHQSGKKEEKK